jgi:hypothetical protein
MLQVGYSLKDYRGGCGERRQINKYNKEVTKSLNLQTILQLLNQPHLLIVTLSIDSAHFILWYSGSNHIDRIDNEG